MDHNPTYQELLNRLGALEREEGRRKDAEEFAEAVLNSLSAHIAILDREGVAGVVCINLQPPTYCAPRSEHAIPRQRKQHQREHS